MGNPGRRSALASFAFFLIAAALASVVFLADRRLGRNVTPSAPAPSRAVAEVAAAMPDDPGLAERLASRWSDVAGAVARAEGAAGLRALDLFGEEAADIFSRHPGSFRDLTAIMRLARPLRESCAGPWREAVLQWARAGNLGPLTDHLARLDHDQRHLLAGTPGCLALLGRGATTAEAMLTRYGERAWRLFLVVDFAEDVAGVERVANSLATYGDRMLRVNESHGPALSFMFIPPVEDSAGHLPRLFAESIDRLGVEDAGALFLANYDDLGRLVLTEGRTTEEVIEAIDMLAGQPEEVRALAPDSGLIIRLLMERRGREPIGAEILARCGPEAADLLFEDGGYAAHLQEKAAAIAVLSRRGWLGSELLRTFRDDESWHRLLRRSDLMDGDDEPLIVRLAAKLEKSFNRQDEIERYLGMPREQIVGLDLPASVVGQALEWIPGYVAVHTVYNAARGYRIETSEIAMAVFDGVSTATFAGKLAAQTIKTLGRQVAKAEYQMGADRVVRQASLQFAAKESRSGARTLLTRLPGALTSVMRSLPKQLPTLDVTTVMRSSSALAKKVGVRTWGKLDRRIIMRGDRKVVMDLFDPKVISLIGEEVRDNARKELGEAAFEAVQWMIVSKEVGMLGPCIMERVHPGLRVESEELVTSPDRASPSPAADAVPLMNAPQNLSNHPAFTSIASATIVACLALAIPRVRRALARRIVPGSERSVPMPRRYEE